MKRALIVAVTLVGCATSGESENPARTRPQAPPTTPSSQAGCFVGVPGAHVVAEDLPGGLALTYSVGIADVGSLRRVVRELAAQQNRTVPGEGQVGDVELRPGDDVSLPASALLAPGARATVTDTTLGARLTLVPVTPEARALLRAQVRAAAAAGGNGVCPPNVRLTPRPAAPTVRP